MNHDRDRLPEPWRRELERRDREVILAMLCIALAFTGLCLTVWLGAFR